MKNYDIINLDTFGGKLRMGDVLGMLNVLEYLSTHTQDFVPIKFYIDKSILHDSSVILYNHLWEKYSNYLNNFLSKEPFGTPIPLRNVNIWDYRDIMKYDILELYPDNHPRKKKKIVLNPLIDAYYNTYRNWPIDKLKYIVKQLSSEKYDDYFRIVCCSENNKDFISKFVNTSDWIISTDLVKNFTHIEECELYVGGDTGLTHYASSLLHSPSINYVISSRSLLHTFPIGYFGVNSKDIVLSRYWVDMENNQIVTLPK